MARQCENFGWLMLKIVWKETYDADRLSSKLIIDDKKELLYIAFQQT